MEISKYLMIDERIKYQKFHLSQIKRNKCKKDCYLLCTPVYNRNLFEIIKGRDLTKKYQSCYLIGLAEDEETARDYLIQIIDKMYNLRELVYEELKA
ncbi:MAG: hypothetical protein RR324_05165 [Cellulosilyticaceae bacterium]